MSDPIHYIAEADHILMQVMIRLTCLICVGFFIAVFVRAKYRDFRLNRHGLTNASRSLKVKNKTFHFHHSLDISVDSAPEKETPDKETPEE